MSNLRTIINLLKCSRQFIVNEMPFNPLGNLSPKKYVRSDKSNNTYGIRYSRVIKIKINEIVRLIISTDKIH